MHAVGHVRDDGDAPVSRFAESQPRDGDCIATCGHDGERHWFDSRSRPAPMPDGCVATWIVTCAPCRDALFDGRPVVLVSHGRWDGNAPIIEAAS